MNRFVLPIVVALAQGLPAQSHLVADFNPGIAASSVAEIAVLGDLAIFVTLDPVSGSVLRAHDSTTGATSVVAVLDSTPPFGAPSGLTTVGSRVVMNWGDSTTGSELWATDGTAAGTGLVLDIRPGTFSGNPMNFGVVDGVCYFAAASVGANLELWRTDGTASGTWAVAEIHSSPSTGSVPSGFTKLGTSGSFLFAATDATAGRELWISDGTAAGTALVKDIVPGPGAGASSNPSFLVAFGGAVYFATGGELWTSDGTAAGTATVTASGLSPRNFVVQGGQLLFLGNDTTHGAELWASDGTAAGTHLVADVNPFSTSGSNPSYLTAVGSHYVFFAATTALGTELWRTDGTATGTELFQDIFVGSGSSSPLCNGHLTNNSSFAVAPNGNMFFVAQDGTHGAEPFVYDTGVFAESTTFGIPCAGLSLHATTPWLDSTVALTTSFIPATSPFSIDILSLTGFDPGVDLTFLDLPGCFLYCMLDVLLPFAGTGTVVVPFAIPDDPTWLGAVIYGQTLSFVPGINPFGAITSNAVTMAIGDL